MTQHNVQDTVAIASLRGRLDEAHDLLGAQARVIEDLLAHARTERDEPGAVDWEQVVSDYEDRI